MDYKQAIAESLAGCGISENEIKELIIIPPDKQMGDYCLPCFKFAKLLRKSPSDIAGSLAKCMHSSEVFCKAEAASGYLNFFIDRNFLVKNTVDEILSSDNYGASNQGGGKTVCIDYSSINIAKPFHIGHLSTTVIGGALYRIYKYMGYNAVGINHLGDWGTQFGKLICAYRLWSSKEQILSGGIKEMLRIYVKFHEEAEKDKSLDDEARRQFKLIEDSDEEALSVFNLFKEITLKEVDKVYRRLNIEFDSYNGESFYNDKTAAVVKELEDKNLIKKSDGAYVVDLDKFDMPPCLILKADKATLYATRDIAAAIYRKNTYDFYKCLYVVAYQQNLHFKQLFKVIELMGYDWAKDLEHVAFGMVSLEDIGSLSTRRGNVIFLEDVLDKCAQKALEIITVKNPQLENKEQTAEIIGCGAVIFSALINNRIKDIVFNYDRVLSFEGETGPYLQYTCVRANSVLNKAKGFTCGISCESLSEIEFELCKLLGGFKEVLKDVIRHNEPSFLTRRLIEIAKCFNKFYFECKILSEKDNIKNRRLIITAATLKTLKIGLKLLGIKIPDSM
ncbi:MAG: arginine--tRNA ligase [Clostridia bacterium]|nr:arginine--tRNA ligase [Clostridia bacterium]